MKKLLIVYYSQSCGNTARIAKALQAATGADLFRIETEKPYEGSYEEVVDEGQREVEAGYEPPVKPCPYDLSSYDVIAVGTPTWWYTMAPAVRTFLHGQDFTGKTVVPFMTNGGWEGHVIADLKTACHGAAFAEEFCVRFDSEGGDHMETPEVEVGVWCERVKSLIKRKNSRK